MIASLRTESPEARARRVRRGPGFWGFLLAHHGSDQLDRCYHLWLWERPIWICARCLGVYPVSIAVFGAQLAWPLPPGPLDLIWLFCLPVPSLIDWGRSRLLDLPGRNWVRTVTGTLLGVALGRAIFLHAAKPGHPLAMSLLGALALFALGVEIRRWSRGRE